MVSDLFQGFTQEVDSESVLILVLMEYGLGRQKDIMRYDGELAVLILVLMEYGLGRGSLLAMQSEDFSS